MSEEFTTERASFIERVASMAGGTTYREPVAPGSRSDHLPDAHAIATAMAYARRGPTDIGPDIAVAIATGVQNHRTKVCIELSAALLASTGRVGERASNYLVWIAAQCWLSVTGFEPKPRPLGLSERDYLFLLSIGNGILWQAAESALVRAQKAYCKAA